MKSLRIPLSDEAYAQLKAEAAKADLPASILAREAVDSWLKIQARKIRQEAIAAYAAEYAGTEFDLDPALEAAGVQFMLDEPQRSE